MILKIHWKIPFHATTQVSLMLLESEKESKLFQLRNHPLGQSNVSDVINEDRSSRKQGIK